jgi:pyruvate/2-oxoglutarate dehydrogenase complex dihydrolipoamide dehydrogenase (E3) component
LATQQRQPGGVALKSIAPACCNVLVGSDDRILGFTMIGPEAGEVMAVVQTAMLADLPYTRLRDAVIAHLTMAEGLGPLLSDERLR